VSSARVTRLVFRSSAGTGVCPDLRAASGYALQIPAPRPALGGVSATTRSIRRSAQPVRPLARLRGSASGERSARLHAGHQRATAWRAAVAAAAAHRHRHDRMEHRAAGGLASRPRRDERHAVSPHGAAALLPRPGVLRVGAHRRKRYAGRGGAHHSRRHPPVAVRHLAPHGARHGAGAHARRTHATHHRAAVDSTPARAGAPQSRGRERERSVDWRHPGLRGATRGA